MPRETVGEQHQFVQADSLFVLLGLDLMGSPRWKKKIEQMMSVGPEESRKLADMLSKTKAQRVVVRDVR